MSALKILTQRLMASEAGDGDDDSLRRNAAAELVFDKLRSLLSSRLGRDGYRTLLVRSLTLTQARYPQMTTLSVAADGSFQAARGSVGVELTQTVGKDSQQDTVVGSAAILYDLLGLLTTLIGDRITVRILSTTWPDPALSAATDWKNDTP